MADGDCVCNGSRERVESGPKNKNVVIAISRSGSCTRLALSQGTRLGTYEITGQIGAGGMGEVYRAADIKLGRDVAIKTLPAALASDRDRLARFEREAKLLAALNHPHIASVYSLDEHEGTLYLAMELVEGETLEEKLKPGALPVEDALRLVLQIAEALEAAHDKGVVHRDLKPANVMVTADGIVKVLDFGLAKAFSTDSGESSLAHSPALSAAMTQQGLVLGTAGYMSPEQASGQGTDQRADIWAFGVVLYEALAGLPLFRGESVPHILADVLKTEPDWDRLPANLHPRIRQLLERCLTKKPRNRLHSIADARIEIETVLSAPEGTEPAAIIGGVEATGPNRLLLAGAFAFIAFVGALAGWFARPSAEPPPKPVARFSVPLQDGQVLTSEPTSLISISPDGTRIVYAADRQLYLRNLSESEARPIPGTQMDGIFGANSPTFSPDGQWVAFLDSPSTAGPYTLLRVPVSGGAPVRLHVAEGLPNFQHGLTWPTDDSILFANAEGIVSIPANGGNAEVLVPRVDGERFYGPQLLPGGDAVLFTVAPGAPGSLSGFDESAIVVQSIGAGDRTVIRPGGRAARFLPTGHLVYAEGRSLFAVPFDLATRSVRGGSVPLMDGLRGAVSNFSDTANFAISDTGTLVNLPGALQDPSAPDRVLTTLSWVHREGRDEPLPVRPDDYTMVRVSPDGTKAALVVGAHINRELLPTIWIYDFDTANLSLLTSEPAGHDAPVWSADSRRLFFRGPLEPVFDVYVADIETREVSLIANGSAEDFPLVYPWSLSPDEDTLTIVNSQGDAADLDLGWLSMSEAEFSTGLGGPGVQSEPVLSPVGGWLAYYETLPGAQPEINVRPYPEIGRTRVPVGPGQQPAFSRDGSELFFFDGEGIAVADVAYEPSLRIGTPRRLFEATGFISGVVGRSWDPDPNGERILMIRDPGTAQGGGTSNAASLRIDVVLNWFEELEERVPLE